MLDTLTLLVVLIVSNLLMAGALWITFAGRFRAGLGPWTGSLIVQGFSWLLVAMRNDIADAEDARAKLAQLSAIVD